MGLDPGSPVWVAYLTVNNQQNIFREFLISAQSVFDTEPEQTISIPSGLLERADISDDSDIQILCAHGAIMIIKDLTPKFSELKAVLESLKIAGDLIEGLPQNAGMAIDRLCEIIESGMKETNKYDDV